MDYLKQSLLYEKYKDKDVRVIGIATAFEDYDKNNIENLKLLLSEGKVIGETFKALRQHGKLVKSDRLYYKIPFPVAMDRITKMPRNISDDMIKDFIEIYFPDYGYSSEKEKEDLFSKVKAYLRINNILQKLLNCINSGELHLQSLLIEMEF